MLPTPTLFHWRTLMKGTSLLPPVVKGESSKSLEQWSWEFHQLGAFCYYNIFPWESISKIILPVARYRVYKTLPRHTCILSVVGSNKELKWHLVLLNSWLSSTTDYLAFSSEWYPPYMTGFLTAASCPWRDFYTHTHPSPPKNVQQSFVFCYNALDWSPISI